VPEQDTQQTSAATLTPPDQGATPGSSGGMTDARQPAPEGIGESRPSAPPAGYVPQNIYDQTKSKLDKQIADERRRAEDRLKERDTYWGQQLQQMQGVLREIAPDQMPDLERAQLVRERDEYAQKVQEYERTLARQEALSGMAQQFGVPMEELLDVEEPYQAYEKAISYKDRMLADYVAKVRQYEEAAQSESVGREHAPVMDIGRPVTEQSELQEMFEKAFLDGDMETLTKVGRYASEHDIELDRVSVARKKFQKRR